MEFLSIIVEKIADYTIEPVARQVGYVRKLKTNVENLKDEVDKLVDAKERVQHSVDEALRKCHKIHADVEKWLKKVDEMIAEASEFLEDENQVKKECLFGLCPNLISRYRPSRKAIKLAQKVVEIPKGGAFSSVSYTTPPEDIWTSSVGYYQAFESRLLVVTKIMKELTDSNNHRIGVYGMAGVGKTTLVKEIAMRAEEQKLFKVAKVEVRQDTDLNRIQKEIAEKFGLELNENLTIAGRARLLTDYIKKNKNVLVILDDVWEMLELEKLGLPFGICKVLLTSRRRDLLSSEFGTQKEFLLKVLKEEESWSLFENIVADDVKDLDIRDTAIQVSKRCAGLPILVVTLAKALRGKSLHSWKDALRLQKMCEGKEIQEKAYSGIEWSYNHLEGEEVKSLFLIFGMLGQHNFFYDLLKYTKGMDLSLFEGINTMEEAHSRLHSLVDKLKDSCLLLDTADREWIEMHDLIRDVAIKIASRDQCFLSLVDGDEFNDWPNKVFLEKCTLISFDRINIPKLPEQLECPKLQLFQLCPTKKLLPIPHNFFKEMKELKVLDLTKICMQSLPPSIHFLKNLQTLCLDQCELRNIAMVGELRSLEILSFVGSKFKLLPKEIGQLTRLRVLDLRVCSQLEVIHPNVLSSLTKLEELRMNNNFIEWEIEDVSNISERSNASLSELKHLSNLTRLDANVKEL